VLDRLRAGAETNGIPVIVVSADATPAKIDALLARGAFDIVTKPVDIARLVAVVDDALVGSPAG
jgi:CheY-like chemotaxis protein